jgi:signal transduction histidine kinase
VRALTERVSATSGLDIALDIDLMRKEGAGDVRYEEEIESTLYRLVQEGLTNIVRHADAGNVHVTLRERGPEVTVEVHDDGRGFDPGAGGAGVGLVGMRERIALVGGTLQIDSAPGQGAVIAARVPARHRPPGSVSPVAA